MSPGRHLVHSSFAPVGRSVGRTDSNAVDSRYNDVLHIFNFLRVYSFTNIYYLTLQSVQYVRAVSFSNGIIAFAYHRITVRRNSIFIRCDSKVRFLPYLLFVYYLYIRLVPPLSVFYFLSLYYLSQSFSYLDV